MITRSGFAQKTPHFWSLIEADYDEDTATPGYFFRQISYSLWSSPSLAPLAAALQKMPLQAATATTPVNIGDFA